MTPAQKVRLGAFVATGIALFVSSIVFVLGLRLLEAQDVYTIHYQGNVSGLELGSAVRYQGLRVGTVSGMEVDADDPSAIEIEIALEPGTRLFEGTEAVLELSGITGLKSVNLVPGDPRRPRLEPGARIPPGSSFVQRISGDAEAIAEKVERLAENLGAFISPANARRVESVLTRLDRLLEQVNSAFSEFRTPIGSALAQAQSTGAALERTSNQLRTTLRAVEPEAVGALRSARGALDEAQKVLAAVPPEKVRDTLDKTNRIVTRIDRELAEVELESALQDLQTALVRLAELLDEVDLVVRGGRQDFMMSLKAIRETTEDLREFSRMIARDPSLLLRGTESGK